MDEQVNEKFKRVVSLFDTLYWMADDTTRVRDNVSYYFHSGRIERRRFGLYSMDGHMNYHFDLEYDFFALVKPRKWPRRDVWRKVATVSVDYLMGRGSDYTFKDRPQKFSVCLYSVEGYIVDDAIEDLEEKIAARKAGQEVLCELFLR